MHGIPWYYGSHGIIKTPKRFNLSPTLSTRFPLLPCRFRTRNLSSTPSTANKRHTAVHNTSPAALTAASTTQSRSAPSTARNWRASTCNTLPVVRNATASTTMSKSRHRQQGTSSVSRTAATTTPSRSVLSAAAGGRAKERKKRRQNVGT